MNNLLKKVHDEGSITEGFRSGIRLEMVGIIHSKFVQIQKGSEYVFSFKQYKNKENRWENF